MDTQQFKEHCEQNNRDFLSINQKLDKIIDNHLAHIEGSMNTIENKVIELDTNQKWQLKFFWIVAGTVITTLLATILK